MAYQNQGDTNGCPPKLPPRNSNTIYRTTPTYHNSSTEVSTGTLPISYRTPISTTLAHSSWSLYNRDDTTFNRADSRGSLDQSSTYSLDYYDESENPYADVKCLDILRSHPSYYRSMAEIPMLTRERSRIEKNSFVSTRIPLSDKDMTHGTFVKDTLHFPSEKWPNNVTELVRLYNAEGLHDRVKQDLKKHIVTKHVIDLKGKDPFELAVLLRVRSHDIKDIIVTCLLEKTLEPQNTNKDDISHTINSLFDVLPEGDINVLLILFNIVCNIYSSSCLDATWKKGFCTNCQKIRKKTKDQNKTLRETTELLNIFSKHFESTKDCTEGSRNVVDIEMRQDIYSGYNFFQQYNYIFLLLSKVFTMPSNIQKYVDKIQKVVSLITSKKDKPKEISRSKSALLRLVVASCFFLLKNDTHLDLQSDQFTEKLLDILDLIFGDIKVPQEIRLSLIFILEPLLLVENKHIVRRVHYLFIKNCQCPTQMSKLVKESISRELCHTGIKFARDNALNEQSPVWQIIEGTFAHAEKEITLHCLMPSQKCLIERTSKDCIGNSDKTKTDAHLNNLRILMHLQDQNTHSSIIQLLAYQLNPIPVFYMIENVQTSMSITLNEFLLKLRKKSKWLTKKSAANLALQVVDVVSYLHSKCVVHRDLTSHSFWVCESGDRLMLCDFSIALLTDDKTKCRKDVSCEMLPALWTAPESILEDKFSIESDTWMLGHVLYEIFTHGCQPYTEMYTFSIDKILTYVVFHELRPKGWPCIPKIVHVLILDILRSKPGDRINTANILDRLTLFVKDTATEKMQRSVSGLYEDDKVYPNLDPKQGKPVRGLPDLFQEFKRSLSDGDVIYNTYMNLQLKERTKSNMLRINLSELTSADRPFVEQKDGYILVNEAVTTSCVNSIRLNLTKDTYETALHIIKTPEWSKCQQQNEFEYLLKYEMRCCSKLTEIASSRKLGDPSNESNLKTYLEVVQKMVKFVMDMNSKHWILGSIRCSDMYLTTDNEKIVMARLGGLKWIDTAGLDGDHIISNDCSTDCFRWCPIEVLQFRQYSFASDVYSLAMAINEFFMALSVNQNDPMAGELESAPFPFVPADDLQGHLYASGEPDKPEMCPDGLYRLLRNCWHRDSEKRLSCEALYEQIQILIDNSSECSIDTHYEDISDSDNYDLYERSEEMAEYHAVYNDQYDNPVSLEENYDTTEPSENQDESATLKGVEEKDVYEEITPFTCVNSESESDDSEKSPACKPKRTKKHVVSNQTETSGRRPNVDVQRRDKLCNTDQDMKPNIDVQRRDKKCNTEQDMKPNIDVQRRDKKCNTEQDMKPNIDVQRRDKKCKTDQDMKPNIDVQRRDKKCNTEQDTSVSKEQKVMFYLDL